MKECNRGIKRKIRICKTCSEFRTMIADEDSEQFCCLNADSWYMKIWREWTYYELEDIPSTCIYKAEYLIMDWNKDGKDERNKTTH